MKIKGLYRMPGSRFLWYRWTVNGRRYAVSLKTTDPVEAIQKIQSGEHFQHVVKLTAPTTDASKAVARYLRMAQERPKKPMRVNTAARQGAVLNKFLRDYRIVHVEEITLDLVTRWIGQKLSADTRHTYARVLKTFLNYLADNKLLVLDLEDFHIPDRSPRGRKNWLKSDVCSWIIRKAEKPELKFILYAGFHAGLRRDEIVNAKVGWFDLETGFLHVREGEGFKTKDREDRMIPLTKEFLDFLRGFLANRQPDEFAIRPNKKQTSGTYRYDFNKSFKTHIRNSGSIQCTIHDMRRSFASNLLTHGESIYVVAKWLGDSVGVVERSYGHLAPTAGDISRLNGRVPGTSHSGARGVN